MNIIIKPLLIVGVLLVIWIIGGKIFMNSIEILGYEVLEKNDTYEIRNYQPYLVAQATVSDDFSQGMSGGFRVLADYIFGNNTKNGSAESIAMTSPVIDSQSQNIAMTSPVIDQPSDTRILKFVLPQEYDIDSLPTPNNKNVQIIENPGGTYAALRYTGFRNEAKVQRKTDKLFNALKQDNVSYDTESIEYFYYDAPTTFPWARRNEVLVKIEK